MSVGDALDVFTHEVDVTNLAEARAMNSARKAAALRENQTPRVKRDKRGRKKHTRTSSKRKTKKQTRARSKPPRHKAKSHRRARTEEPRTDPRTSRRRSFIDEGDARATTALYLGDDDNGTDDDQPPPLDGSSNEEKQYSEEDAAGAAAAEGASVIATPVHERVVVTSGDTAFIKGSDESDTPASGGQVSDDEDWRPSDDSTDSDYARRHALVVPLGRRQRDTVTT